MFLASHPGSTHYPADCRAFDDERSAEAWARGQTARGVRSVVVYFVPDVSPYGPESADSLPVAHLPTRTTNGPQNDAERFEESA